MSAGVMDPPPMTRRTDVSVKMDAEVIVEAKLNSASLTPNTTPLSNPEVLHARMPVVQESPCFPGFPWDIMDESANIWSFR